MPTPLLLLQGTNPKDCVLLPSLDRSKSFCGFNFPLTDACEVWKKVCSVQTRWLGRGKASRALFVQEAEEVKLIPYYGRLFLDPEFSHMVRSVLFHLDYNDFSALKTPPRIPLSPH